MGLHGPPVDDWMLRWKKNGKDDGLRECDRCLETCRQCTVDLMPDCSYLFVIWQRDAQKSPIPQVGQERQLVLYVAGKTVEIHMQFVWQRIPDAFVDKWAKLKSIVGDHFL